ncbi:Cross-pathway control protein 1, partial [Zancudomyces culisetae]
LSDILLSSGTPSMFASPAIESVNSRSMIDLSNPSIFGTTGLKASASGSIEAFGGSGIIGADLLPLTPDILGHASDSGCAGLFGTFSSPGTDFLSGLNTPDSVAVNTIGQLDLDAGLFSSAMRSELSDSNNIKPEAGRKRLAEDVSAADEYILRSDSRFNSSLPPQLALKRKRARSTKYLCALKEMIDSDASQKTSPDASKPGKEDPKVSPENVQTTRNKNTDAARRSRLRKALRLDSLEKQVVTLEAENTKLRDELKVYESEKSKFAEREELLRDHIRSMNAIISSLFGKDFSGSSAILNKK